MVQYPVYVHYWVTPTDDTMCVLDSDPATKQYLLHLNETAVQVGDLDLYGPIFFIGETFLANKMMGVLCVVVFGL